MKYLAVKNFAEHQHYRDRIPPWIKFYNRVLDDYDFIQLSGATRSHLMLIWLLASRHKNRIPYDPKYIAGAIHARERVDLDALIGAGWLLIVEDSASADASTDASADASKSGDVEREKREREKKPPRKPAVVRTAIRPPDGPAFVPAPYLDAYASRFPGATLPAGRIGRALKPLDAAHGPAETLARWKVFLAAKGELGPEYFARTWSEWGPRQNGAVKPDDRPRALAATEMLLGEP